MKWLTTLVLLIAIGVAYGQHTWIVDSSSVSFQIRNAGIIVDGTFDGLEAEIDFNPKKLRNSKIIASVDAASVDTGIRIRNNHLRKSEYLAVETYSRIVMSSESFQKKSEEDFIGEFTINLKGEDGKVSFPFQFRKVDNFHTLSGEFEINRRDYDVGDKSLILDDKVKVRIWVRVKESN